MVFRSPVFTKERAIYLVGLGPNYTNLTDCADIDKLSPNFTSVFSPKTLCGIDWDAVLDGKKGNLKELQVCSLTWETSTNLQFIIAILKKFSEFQRISLVILCDIEYIYSDPSLIFALCINFIVNAIEFKLLFLKYVNVFVSLNSVINFKVKHTAIPVTGHGGLWGCEILKIPYCLTVGSQVVVRLLSSCTSHTILPRNTFYFYL
jgi:hypothetical protein